MSNVKSGHYFVERGYLFRASKLCIPRSFINLLLVREAHYGGLMGHFGIDKTLGILTDHFYWPKMKHDVSRCCASCSTCKKTKSKLNPHGLYTRLPIPIDPWEDISMDFIVGLLELRKGGIQFLLSSIGLIRWLTS